MSSEALKNQKITPRKSVNLGRLLEAAAEMRSALELLEHGDPSTLGRVFGRHLNNAAAIAQISDAAEEYRGEALMRAVDSVVELIAELTGGVRPVIDRPFNATEAGRALWGKVRKILELKGWPTNAIDESIDVASDMVNDGEYGALFGDEEGSAAPVNVRGPVATGTESKPEPVICHGCPDAKVIATDPDPRGYPGKLCVHCCADAEHDVSNGIAALAEGFEYSEIDGIRVAVKIAAVKS